MSLPIELAPEVIPPRSSFLSPVQAFFNGLASLITGFFSGLAKNASNLVVLAYITKIKGVYRILIIAVKVVH